MPRNYDHEGAAGEGCIRFAKWRISRCNPSHSRRCDIVCAGKDLNFESSLGQALRNASPSIDLALNKVLQSMGRPVKPVRIGHRDRYRAGPPIRVQV
jgi:hypothetical protein